MFESQLRFIDLLRSGNDYEYRIRYFVVEIEKVKKRKSFCEFETVVNHR